MTINHIRSLSIKTVNHKISYRLTLLFSSLASVLVSNITMSSSSQQLFLMKSEPDVFSITDLSKLPNQTSPWDGVRNFEARKTLNRSY